MRVRSLVLCVVLLGAILGAAGCSSSAGTPASGNSGKESSGKLPAKPGGTVTVKSGGKVVCIITLNQDGTGTCKVSTAQLAAGKVTYTGTYNSVSSNFKSGATGSTTVTIVPGATATKTPTAKKSS